MEKIKHNLYSPSSRIRNTKEFHRGILNLMLSTYREDLRGILLDNNLTIEDYFDVCGPIVRELASHIRKHEGDLCTVNFFLEIS